MSPERREYYLSVLGLSGNVTQAQVDYAYRTISADLKPGANANHGKVALAESMLEEVEEAYESLQPSRVDGVAPEIAAS